jgi:hypothetical protein
MSMLAFLVDSITAAGRARQETFLALEVVIVIAFLVAGGVGCALGQSIQVLGVVPSMPISGSYFQNL